MDDREFDYKNLLEITPKADLRLFHHGGIDTSGDLQFSASMERLKQFLYAVRSPESVQHQLKKVWWMPDKMWFLNDKMGEDIMPLVNYAFFNDENWVRRHSYENAFGLHMGADPKKQGKYRKEYDLEIAFVGTPFNFRKPFLDRLRQKYGNKFKIFDNVWGHDFLDLCKSAKFIFVPPVPNDEFYWGNRVYETLSAGGCLIHPRLYGLKEEGFEDGIHYLGYKRWDDLEAMLEDHADKKEERDIIVKTGRQLVNNNFTYKQRVGTLLDKIK